MLTKEKLDSWYTPINKSMEQERTLLHTIKEAEEEVLPCKDCNGTGKIERLEHVTGDNVMPGGYWEGSGIFDPCHCQKGEE